MNLAITDVPQPTDSDEEAEKGGDPGVAEGLHEHPGNRLGETYNASWLETVRSGAIAQLSL